VERGRKIDNRIGGLIPLGVEEKGKVDSFKQHPRDCFREAEELRKGIEGPV